MTDGKGRFLLYNAGNQWIKAQVMLEWDTVWMSQKSMAELFDVQKSTLSEHFSNIFWEGELDKQATVRSFRTVQIEWDREVERNIEYYNLDAIISVGYRVKLKASNTIPNLGNKCAERVSHQRICAWWWEVKTRKRTFLKRLLQGASWESTKYPYQWETHVFTDYRYFFRVLYRLW